MILARILSYIFHPIFILFYGIMIFAYYSPYSFGERSFAELFAHREHSVFFIWVFLLSVFFPILSVVMMYALQLIKSIEMEDRMDRIGPFIATGVFYLWAVKNFMYFSIHPLCITFALGSTIALFMSFFINIFSKISLHTVGMGGLLAMVLLIMPISPYSMTLIFWLITLMTGAIGTARLLLKAHEPREVYGGYMIGFFGQLLALRLWMPNFFDTYMN